jgi:hypothetical protein
MNKKKTVVIVTLVIWVVTIGWLLRYEAFPSYFTRTLAGYKEMLSSDILMSDSWMLITFNDTPIGYSHSSIEVNDVDPVLYYGIKNEMQLKMPLMGEQHEVNVITTAHLDIMHQLQRFTFSMSSKAADSRKRKENLMEIKATRLKKNTFGASITSPHSTQRSWIEIPPDVVIHSPMTEMALKNLRVGQTMAIKTLEPSTFSTTVIQVKAIRKEKLTLGDTTYDATLLSTDYHGVDVASWIDSSDGSILKQETPFGWNMHRCTPSEALDAVLGESTEDLLKGMSVSCIGQMKDPRNSKRLKLRLTGVRFTSDELTSPRQKVESITPDEVILVTTGGRGQPASPKATPSHGKSEEYLKATTFIQSDNGKMISTAEKITAGIEDNDKKVNAIFDWVYKNVEKKMTVSLPSALDVLNTMSGDCNEHTYLFVALARAAGLPAKIKIGLAFHEGSFYYHAWPAVYADGWIEMDPTWGQRYVDATHLAFVEGELADQLAIVKLLGQLKIEVLNQSETD